MRVTVHIPDKLSREVKTLAENQRQSVSSLTAEALSFYIHSCRRKALARRVLSLSGTGVVTGDALDDLDRMREEKDDRP
jgi:metal-responsive CopG/Arc/MetJ family transcriptional regulator